MTKELLQQAHEMGFLRGVEWAERADLIIETKSAAYRRERDYDVATIVQPAATLMPDYPIFPSSARYEAQGHKHFWDADQMINYARVHGLNCMRSSAIAQPVQPGKTEAEKAAFARGMSCRPASSQPVQPEPCFCDANNIGAPGVSCGDCPTRDYKPVQPAEAWISEKGVQLLMKTEYNRGYAQGNHDAAHPAEQPVQPTD